MSPNKKLRILCVDDDQALSAMLDLYVKGDTPVQGVASVRNFEKALEEIAKERPDIVVVDLSIPGSDPIATIEGIHQRFPDIRIVLYSNQDDQDLIDEAFEAGAIKHVHKSSGVSKLLDAIYEASTP